MNMISLVDGRAIWVREKAILIVSKIHELYEVQF